MALALTAFDALCEVMDISSTALAVEAYLEDALLREDPVLEEVARASEAAGLVPHAVTPLQAEFLAMLIRLSSAKQVLEIGCLGGYSAIAMARALPEDGRVLTTEIDTRTAQIAQANIDQAGYTDKVDLRVGPAMEVLLEQVEAGAVFDFIFIDADKVNHRNYLEQALKLSRPGTLIVADNIVRYGGVVDAESEDNSIRGVRAMFDYARTLEGVEMTALQTVGSKGYDGMALFRVRDL
ncbi:O-methyltransferase [Hyphomonas sp. FCG-A18]|uniref:O-methyltransferase n=1 Tax=Hyphomonas sp. FCG-A18 TaxID=3080019 RepID=UPI002B2905C5|nr:O-methyltransferase [Hyphomonas sp. FCG-A18]